MNTFFFGYLPLRWRRLIRFVVCPVLIVGLAVLNEEIVSEGSYMLNLDYYELPEVIRIIILFVLAFPELAFISWLLKPFITREE